MPLVITVLKHLYQFYRRYFYAALTLGTPPAVFAVIVDTGSTITYVPCSSCGGACGPHHQVHNYTRYEISLESCILSLSPSTSISLRRRRPQRPPPAAAMRPNSISRPFWLESIAFCTPQGSAIDPRALASAAAVAAKEALDTLWISGSL